jgi:hypothetical protein
MTRGPGMCVDPTSVSEDLINKGFVCTLAPERNNLPEQDHVVDHDPAAKQGSRGDEERL